MQIVRVGKDQIHPRLPSVCDVLHLPQPTVFPPTRPSTALTSHLECPSRSRCHRPFESHARADLAFPRQVAHQRWRYARVRRGRLDWSNMVHRRADGVCLGIFSDVCSVLNIYAFEKEKEKGLFGPQFLC